MPLLNLPPEIFQQIIHNVVSRNYVKAWNMRGVSRAFAYFITHDILMHYPLEVFTRAEITILRHNAAKLLFNRLKKPHDANVALLDKIRQMGDFLCLKLGYGTESQAQARLAKLCQSVVEFLEPDLALCYLRDDSPYYLRKAGIGGVIDATVPLDLPHKIIAAVAIDARELVCSSLLQLTDVSQWQTDNFTSPLIFAISQGNTTMVHEVLRLLEFPGLRGISLQEMLCGKRGDTLATRTSAMLEAISRGHFGVLQLLANFHERHVGHFTGKQFDKYLTLAIKCAGSLTVPIILRLKVSGTARVTRDHVERAAHSDFPEIMVAVSCASTVGINRSYADTSPLICAVQAGKVRTVQAVLDAGAEINMTVGKGERSKTALIVAMKAGRTAITQVLLDRGADIPPESTWPGKGDRKGCKFAGVRQALRNERQKRGGD